MSLRTRFALLAAIIVGVAAAIAGIGTAVSAVNLAEDRVDRELEREASQIPEFSPQVERRLVDLLEFRQQTCTSAGGFDDDNDDGGRDRRGGLARRGPGFDVLEQIEQIVAKNGTIISVCAEFNVNARDLEIAAAGIGRDFRTETLEGTRFRVLTLGVGEPGAVQISRELGLVEQALSGLVTRFAIFGLLASALAAGIGWILANRAIRPVRDLSRTAERVATTRDLGERIDLTSDDELGGLARSFNTMLESLETSRSQQRRLVQDASHELRTPLTSIRTNIAFLHRHPDLDSETTATVLHEMNREIEELTDLTDELVLSATEVHLSPADTIDFAFADLISDAAAKATRRHQRSFEIESANPAEVHGDPRMLRRAVDNLLNNAAKFDPGSSTIEILLDGGSITVLDNGPGIDPDDLPHIFDRFYRATQARSAPGSGLGLAIVHQIVEAHDGNVHAANRPAGGAAVGFELPTISADPSARTPG